MLEKMYNTLLKLIRNRLILKIYETMDNVTRV